MSDDPQDRLLLQIRGAVAEYERTLIGERMRRGRLYKLQGGLMLPWTRTPYGYRADPDRPRDPAGVRTDPAEAATVAALFGWYADEGRSFMAVVQRLHDLGVRSPSGREYWGVATVRGILTNPTYTGTIYANRTRVRPARVRRSSTHALGRPEDSRVPLPPDQWLAVATIPAIVAREQFDRVRDKIATNRSFARRNNTASDYLLRALVSCGSCRLACQARRAMPSGRTYYICTGKGLRVRQRLGCTCPSRFIPAGALDELVWSDLADLLRHPERVAQALRRAAGGCGPPQELRARRENLRRGRSSLARQVERLTEAYLGGVLMLNEYRRRYEELERRDGTLAEQEKLLSGEASRASELSGLADAARSFAERVGEGLDAATFERRRQLVELLVDRVVVTGDEVEIRYAFPIGPAGETGRFCHLRVDYLVAPDVVLPLGPQPGARAVVQPEPAPPRRLLRDLQALAPPQPLDPLVIDLEALGPQQGRDPAGAVPAILDRRLDHPRHQPGLVIGHGGRAPLRGAGLAQDLARPALRDAIRPEHPSDVLDRLAPLRRAQYFPAAASLRIALSSSASASSRLRRPFSFSSSLSLLA
jgi:site-specific DNA recombinase